MLRGVKRVHSGVLSTRDLAYFVVEESALYGRSLRCGGVLLSKLWQDLRLTALEVIPCIGIGR